VGEFTVHEEPDRYVMRFDPCGTGGVLRRGDVETGGAPMETDGLTVTAADWNWNKTGVHYYVFLEKFPGLDWGFPVRPMDHVLNHHKPCTWLRIRHTPRPSAN
jgi:hypothetical protein